MCAILYTTTQMVPPSPTKTQWLLTTYTTMSQLNVENDCETEVFKLRDAVSQSSTFRRVMSLLWQLAPKHKDNKYTPTATAPHSRSLDPLAPLLLDRQTSHREIRVRGRSPIQRVNLSPACLSLAH